MTIPGLDWSVSADIVTIGVLTGLAYAILAAGIVLVYRSTRTINLAHGEIGAFGSALLAKMVLDWGISFWLALPAVIVVGALIGAAVDMAVVRRLFRAPRLILLVATIGISQVVFLFRVLLPRIENVQPYPTPLGKQIEVSGVLLGSSQLMVLAFVPAVMVGLALFLGRTPLGIAIRASADNQDRAQLGGIPIKRVSTIVWALAGGLAVLTVVLLDPLRSTVVGLPSPTVGPSLLLRALAAALVGRLVSIPLALAGGVFIGVLEAVVFANAENPGLIDALLFVVVIVLILRQGAMNDERSGGFSLGPRIRTIPAEAMKVWHVRHLGRIGFGGLLLVAFVMPFIATAPSQSYLFTRVVIFVIIGFSVTVLTGWAGQLSLGQIAFVGVGALTATSLVSRGMSFPTAACYAAVAGALCALIVGFPALRVRGPFLALTTLAFAVGAQGWLYYQPFFGTDAVFSLPRSTVLGVDLSVQRNYYWMCLAFATLIGLAVIQLRRTGAARNIIAVRDNPSAAATFTISPVVSTLSAFVFSGAIAGFAGALYAGAMVTFSLTSAGSPPVFGPGESLALIAMVVIGGLGSVPGAVLGALWVIGLPAIFGSTPEITVATSGIGLLILLLFMPGGLAQGLYALRDQIVKRALVGLHAPQTATPPGEIDVATAAATLSVTAGAETVVAVSAVDDVGEPPRATHVARPPRFATAAALAVARPAPGPGDVVLDVSGIAVEFTGRRVLDGAVLQVAKGEIVGLIGSNGAGKSTLMNVISGFVKPVAGEVLFNGVDVTGLAPHQRARLGIGRVFQDARLFSELTLRETVSVALEAHERSEFLPSLLGLPPSRRAERRKVAQADEYIDFLGLGRYAPAYLGELSTGTRRIVEMCCLLAGGSELLLLDEPTAGVAQRETEAFGPLIERIRKELDATVVIIEHDIPLIMSISNHVYCYAAGFLIANGLPDEVRNDPAVVAAYLGTDERAIERSDSKPQPAPSAQPLNGTSGSNAHHSAATDVTSTLVLTPDAEVTVR